MFISARRSGDPGIQVEDSNPDDMAWYTRLNQKMVIRVHMLMHSGTYADNDPIKAAEF
jgi:hypothetical protein